MNQFGGGCTGVAVAESVQPQRKRDAMLRVYGTAVEPLPLQPGDNVPLDDGHAWTVAAVSEHFTALTRPVTDRDRDEIYSEYEHDCGYDQDDEGCQKGEGCTPGLVCRCYDNLSCDFPLCGIDPPNLDGGGPFYTVIDWRSGVRGPCNLIGQSWGDGTYSPEECAAMLAEFEAGELEVSHRNRVLLTIGGGV